MPGNQHRDIATHLASGSNGIGNPRLEPLAVVLCYDQDCHLNHPRFVLEFCDEFRHVRDLDAGAALGRLIDAQDLQAGVMSTPSASGFTTSRGFFFAFMMLGSVT